MCFYASVLWCVFLWVHHTRMILNLVFELPLFWAIIYSLFVFSTPNPNPCFFLSKQEITYCHICEDSRLDLCLFSLFTRGGTKSLFCKSQVSLKSLPSSPESSPESRQASPESSHKSRPTSLSFEFRVLSSPFNNREIIFKICIY